MVEVALVVLIDYTSPGNWIFGTAPIGVGVWVFLAPCAAAMLVAEEVRKTFVRGRSKRAASRAMPHGSGPQL
jgi:hypothetical protein